jgi:hypothetical protein
MLDVDGDVKPFWIEVKGEYSSGLVVDRVDGFVVGLLGYALKYGHDIRCEAPITNVLKDSIAHDFIDVVCQHQPEIYHVRLIAPTITPIHKSNVVRATGLSCGVDCMYTVHNRMLDDGLGSRYFYMVDAHMQSRNQSEADKRKRFKPLLNNAEAFAAKLGIPLVVASTNWGPLLLDKLTIENNTTYCNCFAALCMQNLFNIYYLASGGPIRDFAVKYLKNGLFKTDCSNYDLLSLSAFSTPALKFIVDGLEKRVDKIKTILSWSDCWDYLDVCEMHHDGLMGNGTFDCHKCMHTVNEIMAVGGIDGLHKFKKVFDVDYVISHRAEYLAYLICQRLERSEVGMETWDGLARQGCSGADYIKALGYIIRKAIRKLTANHHSARKWIDI